MKYYCQPDGGQWNIPVEIHWQGLIDNTEFAIISGIELTGWFRTELGRNVLLVPTTTLYDTKLV